MPGSMIPRWRCPFCDKTMPKSASVIHLREKHKDECEKTEFARFWNEKFDQDSNLTDISISLVFTGKECPSCGKSLCFIANDITKKKGYLCIEKNCKIAIWIEEEKESGRTILVPYRK